MLPGCHGKLIFFEINSTGKCHFLRSINQHMELVIALLTGNCTVEIQCALFLINHLDGSLGNPIIADLSTSKRILFLIFPCVCTIERNYTIRNRKYFRCFLFPVFLFKCDATDIVFLFYTHFTTILSKARSSP